MNVLRRFGFVTLQAIATTCENPLKTVKSRAISMDTETSWRGVPISEIIGSQSPWGAPEFPLVTPSSSHTVLYHIPSEGLPDDRPPKPRVAEDKWDGDHVRLPCSSKSLYPVKDSSGDTHLKKRWQMIHDALSRPITSSEELAEAIISYNTKFRNVWRFTALHALFNDHLDEEEARQFFIVTLPAIAKLALDLPKLVQAPIPLLKQNKSRSISLTQLQIAGLLANAFFCTFPRRNTMKRDSEYASYPNINFSSLYEMQGHDDVIEKLKCLCHYFRRVTTQAPVGVVTVVRRSVPPSECPRWGASDRAISSLPIHVDPDGRIEDAHGLIQLDFANKYLGGGVLGHGSVQEEIRFVICPELIVTMLFTEVLRPKEALLIIGCERYSEYGGYSRTFQWRGDHRARTPRDSSLRRRVSVLAIDALPYHHPNKQYLSGCLIRELNKAWIGMSYDTDEDATINYPGVATGNWGCGAFGGCPELKSLIQIMACSQARRPMAYYTFHDLELRDRILNMYNLLVRYNITVGRLYHYMMRFASTAVRRSQLHAFLHQAIVDDATKPTTTLRTDTNFPNDTAAVTKDEEPDRIQRELNRYSPDLFSQDECQNETETTNDRDKQCDSNTNKHTPDAKRKSTSKFTWDWDKPNNTTEKRHQNTDTNQTELNSYVRKQNETTASSEKKIATNNQTSRLFDQMQKFDEDNGKLNLSYSVTKSLFKTTSITYDNEQSNSFDTSNIDVSLENNETVLAPSENKMADNLMAVENEDIQLNDTTVASTSNQISTQKSRDLFASDCNSTETSSSENTVQSNNDKMEMSPEDTRKKARKITDYFTKKSV